MYYSKPPLSISAQAQLLLDRGLICTNIPRLERYLTSIGYYRLSAYFIPFEIRSSNGDRNHQFLPGTNFDDILKLYIFDRKLRLLVMEAIERIEVALRSKWSGELALKTNNSHAYIDPAFFKCPSKHIRNLAKIDQEIERSRETFVSHYRNKYRSPHLPPIWAVVETMTLGELSRWLENTNSTSIKSAIANMFRMPNYQIAGGVFHALTPVRNVCAHHSRLWNRRFTLVLPRIRRLDESLVPQNSPHHQDHYLYNYLVIMVFLMKTINPNSSWKTRLISLLDTVTANNHIAMGFPANWQDLPIWE